MIEYTCNWENESVLKIVYGNGVIIKFELYYVVM